MVDTDGRDDRETQVTTDRHCKADPDRPGLDRRTVLRGVAVTGALGAAGGLLAGCGGPGETGSGSAEGSTGGSGSASTATSKDLGPAAKVPVGGGTVFKEQKVVVTQPTKGEFVGLSATCTHQGCTVAEVAGGTINCPCHGSKFNLDGSVANGPAASPLPKRQITVKGGEIRLA
jgi:nitrite reductase/ring-hydroxylating ferredoxin subunit